MNNPVLNEKTSARNLGVHGRDEKSCPNEEGVGGIT